MPRGIIVSQTDASGYAKALAEIKPSLTRPLHFLQAPFYGRWQEASGKRGIYFSVKDGNKTVGCGLAIAYTLPRGYYFFYCPYGPLLAKWSPKSIDAMKQFFASLNDKKLLFVRLDANIPSDLLKAASPSAAAVSSLQPRNEWLLDLAPKPDELLASMHKKARYHIRLAEREGAQFRAEPCTLAELAVFYDLMKATGERDHFHILPKSDYQAAFEALAAAKNAFVGYVDFKNKTIAAALCVNYDGQTHYVYGCSSDEFRKLGAGYLLQWQCLLKAKNEDTKIYNFGGVSGGVKGAQLAGVTQFKQRFGGYNSSHSLPADLVISTIGYKLFSIYKKLQKHS